MRRNNPVLLQTWYDSTVFVDHHLLDLFHRYSIAEHSRIFLGSQFCFGNQSFWLINDVLHAPIVVLLPIYEALYLFQDDGICICCRKYISYHMDMEGEDLLFCKKQNRQFRPLFIPIYTYFVRIRKKLSNVGPERPKGSSGGIKWSLTNEYISTRSATTFLNSQLS